MANKYINILSHKGNANQNYTEILSHPSQNGNHQENKQHAGKDAGKNEPSYTVGGI
jgi:hypothetical protein